MKAYFLWKELNAIIKNSHNRGINFPETISESLMCYALDFELNRGTGGDARNPETDEVCEAKATSNWDRDTSSFSPSEDFDRLFFVRLNQREDSISIYDLELDSNDLKQISVSSTQTVGDQQAEKRRPRFSIIKKIIEPNDIQPVASIDLRTKKLTKH
ncbi:Bsp6I family type II restriction endonuclease [Halobacillus faecis]|uniref:Bsp6I restriction endonuclease n=1 Tax=Halobacillus faecis TaxID=360184 RepID=A0A511WWM0_9BACI|nr:Bsp6I family type II restriction endonuclease [Halobacillus faecis]GEN55519.1 hypothetical protein HFA01_37810 [Halobacillus faecis]